MVDTVKLDCFVKGARTCLCLPDAVRMFRESNYAWALPIDHYRWNVEGHSGAAYVCERVKPTPRRFGLYLHTRGTRALTLATLSELEEKFINPRTFHGYAARFGKLFGDLPIELRPFFCYGVDGVGQHPAPAYRMRSSRSWLVIQGVAAGQGLEDDEVDWSPFQNTSAPAANA